MAKGLYKTLAGARRGLARELIDTLEAIDVPFDPTSVDHQAMRALALTAEPMQLIFDPCAVDEDRTPHRIAFAEDTHG